MSSLHLQVSVGCCPNRCRIRVIPSLHLRFLQNTCHLCTYGLCRALSKPLQNACHLCVYRFGKGAFQTVVEYVSSLHLRASAGRFPNRFRMRVISAFTGRCPNRCRINYVSSLRLQIWEGRCRNCCKIRVISAFIGFCRALSKPL